MSTTLHSDQTTIETALAAPEVSGLDLGAFAPSDLANMVLQRSEVLYDVPRSGQVIRAWENGDDGPLNAEVMRLGDTIARRVAAVIFTEFAAMIPTLDAIAPARIADIGCGYGFFSLFAARKYGAHLLLIDLESNDKRHFGFNAEGAAYSSLTTARRFLEANGVAPADLVTVNPETSDVMAQQPVDLAVSFLSCGFHYPLSTYLPFLRSVLTPDGTAVFDLRGRTVAQALPELDALGRTTEIASPPKAKRIVLSKSPQPIPAGAL